MQTQGTSDNSSPTGAPPPEDGARDEDSGLHDIRSMASSAKMRISSKRITTNPPVDDDILASSSAGWKAVALPEPARMVSLPEIDAPVEEAAPSSERKSKKELKAERTSASKIAKEAIAVETSASISGSMSPAPTAKPDIATPIIGARFQQKQQKKSGKGGLYAMLGVGLAAAAGVGWYVSTQMKDSKSASPQVASATEDRAEGKMQAQSERAAAAPAAGSATVTAIAEPTPPPAAEPKADETVATGMGGATSTTGADDLKIASDEGAKRGNAKSAKSDKKKEAEKATPSEKKPDQPKDAPKGDGKKKDGDTDGEPSFDALLKEAGVQDKKPVKVALDKKSLSGADFKKGMGAVAGKAQACYAGTQGTAQLKLTVSPEGSVQKVAVTGVFAGTPVGKCVENAVKGATFPAWDGGPQSFGYSYLLAE